MPGTIKIWWHDGSTRDARYQSTPLINEPELDFETVAVNAAPASSNPAPAEAYVAVLESNVAVRYRVQPDAAAEDASSPRAKPMLATSFATATIGVRPGYRLSFVEDQA